MADMWDVTINGRGLSDYGLYGYSVSGLGVSTYGLVWPCSAIWDDGSPTVTTTWSECSTPDNVEECTE